MYDPRTSQLMAAIQKMDGTPSGYNPAADRKTLYKYQPAGTDQYINGVHYDAGMTTTVVGGATASDSIVVSLSGNGGLDSLSTVDGLSTQTHIAIPGAGGQATITTTNPDNTQFVAAYANGVLKSQAQKGVGGATTTQSQSFGYDPLQRNNSTTNFIGTTSHVLRGDGSIASTTLPDGRVQTATAIDPKTDAPTAVTRTDGNNTGQAINALGQQTDQSGAGLLAAKFGYDNGNGVGQVGNITTYQGTVTTDSTGVITGGAGAAATAFGFDPATGLPTSKTYAGQSSPTDTIDYNSKFQISSTVHGTVFGQNLVYNPAGELTGSSLTDTATGGVLNTATQLNQKGQPNVFSQTALDTNGATTGSATNVLTYTTQDQIGSQSFSTVANDKVVYDYFGPTDNTGSHSAGAIADMKIQTANGTVLAEYDYAYEPTSKRLQSITLKGANQGSDEALTYGYKPNSPLISSITSTNNTFIDGLTYDSSGRLYTDIATNATNQNLYSATYTYNNIDQRSGDVISGTKPDGSSLGYSVDYGYNTQDQLNSVQYSGISLPGNSYTFDNAGNRTDLGAVNLANQYISDTYDSRGNLTDDGTISYAYNPADQLISATPDHPTASSLKCTFAYDAMGNRSQKDVYAWSGNGWVFSYTRKWVYDGTNAVAEFDGNNNLLEGYAWGQNGNLLAVTDYAGGMPKVYLPIVDGSGNVIELIDGASGNVAATFQVDPYGKLLSATGPAANLCPFVWQGHYRDAESGLIFAPNRVELPSQGRWLQRDPSGESGGLNLYLVDKGDPINSTDRSGLKPTYDVVDGPGDVYDDGTHMVPIDNLQSGGNSYIVYSVRVPVDSDPQSPQEVESWQELYVDAGGGTQPTFVRTLAPSENSATLTSQEVPASDFQLSLDQPSPQNSDHIFAGVDSVIAEHNQAISSDISVIHGFGQTLEAGASLLPGSQVFFAYEAVTGNSAYEAGQQVGWGTRALAAGSILLPFALHVIGDGFSIARRANAIENAAGELESSLAGVRGEVAYGSTDLSAMAMEFRQAGGISAERNIAAIEFQTANGLNTVMAASVRGVGHAERIAGARVLELGVHSADVTRVYSELQPCSLPFSRCASYLQRNFPTADVTWSFEYGANSESRKAGIAALERAAEAARGWNQLYLFDP